MADILNEDEWNKIRAIQGEYALFGSKGMQVQLYRLCGGDSARVSPWIRDVNDLEVLTLNQPDLGLFDPVRKIMLKTREYCDFPQGRIYVPRLEYMIGMRLIRNDVPSIVEIGAVLSIGADEVDAEEIRSILKSVGAAESFEKYKIMLYDFSS